MSPPSQPRPDQDRNDTLTRLAGATRRHGADEGEIRALLEVANDERCSPPLPENEVHRIAAGITRYKPDPAKFWVPGANGRMEFASRQLGQHLLSEAVTAVGGERLYRFDRGSYRPDGERWARGRTADLLGDQWKTSHADSTVTWLRDTAPALWEAPPGDRINVANGILDVQTGELEQHDPSFLSPVQIPVSYDPAARCPLIEKFLSEVFPDDAVQVAHELAGYLLTPDNRLRTAVMLVGRGRNGKSVFLSLLTALLGHENVSNRSLQALEENTFATADLYGKLANVFADLDARALRGSSLFKSISGGDRISAERKHKPAFEFKPYARLLFSANQPPPTPDSTDAFFDRWLIVPFEQRFRGLREPGSGPTEDPDLLSKLTTPEELSGFLNLALAALVQLRLESGFSRPDSVQQAARRFKADVDSVAGFVGEDCLLRVTEGPKGEEVPSAPRKILYEAYNAYCDATGRRPVSRPKFYERLRSPDFGLVETARNGERMFKGIGINPDSAYTEERREQRTGWLGARP